MKNPILLVILISIMQSCGVIKSFHKNKSVVDSTYSHKEMSDSLTKVDSSSFHKEDQTTYTKTDSAKTNEETVITEHTTIKEFNDSGKVKKETVIEKRTETKKGSSTGSLTVFENAGKIDSNELKKESELSKQSSDSGHLQKKEKAVVREIRKNRFEWWWFFLLIPAYFIWKHWKGIKAFGVHLITGL